MSETPSDLLEWIKFARELQQENARLGRDNAKWDEANEKLHAQFVRLMAALESAERDARRYRWLKAQRPQPMWASIPIEIRTKHGGLDENAIDAAIDAALAPGDERGEG